MGAKMFSVSCPPLKPQAGYFHNDSTKTNNASAIYMGFSKIKY